MSISERIDLVGNVSAQARKWARDLSKLSAQARALNRAMAGSGVGGSSGRSRSTAASAEARAEKSKAAAMREQARAQASLTREQIRSAKVQQKAANDNAKAQRSAGGGAAGGKKNDYRYTLKRQEMGGVGGAVNSAAGNFAADAAMAAMSAIAGLMKSMGSTFVQAQIFRENSLAGLTILQKSGSEAKKTWDESFKLARATGSTQQETMSSIQTLMATGFKKGDATELYKLMSALSVVNPQANMEGIIRAISQIKNTGRLQGDELMQLADAGVSTESIYAALSKRLGKTKTEIRSLQEAGKISSEDAIWAIKEAAKSTVGGDVEGALKKKANSLGAIVSQLQAAPFTFFSGMEQDPAIAEKMKGSLKGLVDLLDPSTEKGAKFAGSFSKMIDMIAGPGADAFASLMEKAPAIGEALVGLGTSLAPFATIIGWVATPLGWFADGLGIVVSAISAFDAAISSGLSAIGSWISQATAMFSGAGSSMASNLISGIISGIFGGSSGVVSAVVSMAQQAIGAGNAAFAIKSPSRKFKAMGAQLPAGLGEGVYENMGIVEKASRAMASTATGSTGSALPFVGDAMQERGMGRQTTNNFGGMRFNAGGFNVGGPGQAQPQDIANDINRMIQQGIQNFMNKAAEAA